MKTLSSISDLRTCSAVDNEPVFVSSNGGVYVRHPDLLNVDDDGGYIVASLGGGFWVRQITNGGIEPEVYGAVGDGVSDDREAIQSAINYAQSVKLPVILSAKDYAVGASPKPGADYCLLSNGVSIIGSRAIATKIVPVTNLSPGIDYFRIKPVDSVLDWMEIRNILIYPGPSGIKLGRRCFLIDMSEASNSSSVLFDGVYCAPGNDLSLEWITMPINLQGGPANSVFSRCHFWEGVKLVNSGDSISFRNNVFRSSVGSGRRGIDIEGVSASGGQPSQLQIDSNNFDCDGGAIYLRNGLSSKVRDNNIEQSHGTGTPSSAVIDLEGNANRLELCEVTGNNIGIFGSASIGQAIRVHNASMTKIRDNRLLSAGSNYALRGVLVTHSAAHTEITGNSYSGFSQNVLNFGSNTIN